MLIVGLLLIMVIQTILEILPKFTKLNISTKIDFFSKLPAKISQTIFKLVNKNNRAQWLRSLLLGLATGLIPCGWLYMYVAIAGGKQNALEVYLTILTFWIGTLPILAAIGFLGGRFFKLFYSEIRISFKTTLSERGINLNKYANSYIKISLMG